MSCCDEDKSCGDCKDKLLKLEEEVVVLTRELRDTHKKVRSRLDFLLKRIQDIEEQLTSEKS